MNDLKFADLNFGMVYAGSPSEFEYYAAESVETGLAMTEISGEVFDGIKEGNPRKYQNVISANDFVNPVIASELTEQPKTIKERFYESLEIKIESLSIPLKYVCIDFSADRYYYDMFFRRDFVSVINRTGLILEKKGIKLCIPVRIPQPGDSLTAENYRAILMNSMLPNCRFTIEIFPHELKKKEQLFEMIKLFRLDTAMIRFIYEAKNGNLIVEKLMDSILDALDKAAIIQDVFFDPRLDDAGAILKEVHRLDEMLKRKMRRE